MSEKVQHIYDEYKIMPTLQLHQLRVAAVAKAICDSFKQEIDTRSVVLACLFHDMGNIIKSDLPLFPDFVKPEGLEYWQGVKAEYIRKYGTDEHKATETIAEEIGLPAEALTLLKRIGFSNLSKTNSEGTWENKVCSYADMRVGPHGVIPLDERVFEAKKRYEGRAHSVASGEFESLLAALRNIEKDIFSSVSITPEDLNDESVVETIPALREWEI